MYVKSFHENYSDLFKKQHEQENMYKYKERERERGLNYINIVLLVLKVFVRKRST